MQYTEQELNSILDLHRKWLYDEPGGQRANLWGANLREANLRGANLWGANLWGANLREANLRGANLWGANLWGANLREANLWGANLEGANLEGANLEGANLRGANLREANLEGANLREARNAEHFIAQLSIVPQEGSFIGFKQAYYRNERGRIEECVIKLEIPADAKRSNGTGRKCRASKARVISIETKDGRRLDGDVKVFSQHDSSFKYSNGVTVEPTEPFCEDRWEECASGIHFFITREEAVNY